MVQAFRMLHDYGFGCMRYVYLFSCTSLHCSFWVNVILNKPILGMHYVAMAGTTYQVPDPTAIPPVPALTTTALIIIIAAIVIVTCVGLIAIQIWQSKILLKKSSNNLVVIDAIYFDDDGKLMVKDDGTVPMSEIETNGKQVIYLGFYKYPSKPPF